MAWTIKITDEARKDYKKIEGSIRAQVLADMGSHLEIKMVTI